MGFQAQRGNIGPVFGIIEVQNVLFPLFSIANHAFPGAGIRCRKGGIVFYGLDGLQAKNFDMCAGFALKMQTGGHYFGIIEYHECAFRQ